MGDPVQNILSRLDGVRQAVDGQWLALCPAHEDKNASLSIGVGNDGRVLLNCFAGCEVKSICIALGVKEVDLFAKHEARPTTPVGTIAKVYPYHDESGELLYEAVRFHPKSFRQRRPNGSGDYIWNMDGVRRVLYRLPELLTAERSQVVHIPEGEKDVDRLRAAGLTATCNVGGAGKWKREYSEALRDRRVVVIADKDDSGRKHALKVRKGLYGIAAAVHVIEMPGDVKDVSDWFDAGGTVGELHGIIETALRSIASSKDAKDYGDDAGDNHDGNDNGDDDVEEKLSQSQLLVKLAAGVDFWHDAAGTPYATIDVGSHCENHPVSVKAFREWLSRRLWLEHGKVARTQSSQEAISVLRAQAVYDGREQVSAVRLAEFGGAIYLDLLTDDWRVVRVTPSGWEIISNPPVRFLRSRGMLPLPTPVRGGNIQELRRFVNVKEERDFVLMVAWMLGALRGRGPYTIQAVYGEQGSCKSTAQRMQRALVDPNQSPLRCEPKDEGDLMIAAKNSLIVGFDNLSSIPPWLSDGMCRLSTGGGLSKRELYSDGDEIIFDATRPQMFNGITDVATRPDLLDRSVIVTLTPIDETQRRPEDELWREFEAARPRILGALLDALAHGLANLEHVRLTRLPRMADFAKWLVACERGLGWTPGTFMQAYTANRADANASAIESSLIGNAVLMLIERQGDFDGHQKDLKAELEAALPSDAGGRPRLPAAWPKTPHAFGGELRRVAPNLRAMGVNLTFCGKSKHGARVRLERVGKSTSPSSPTSCDQHDGASGGDVNGDDIADVGVESPPRKSPAGNRGDEGDVGDVETSFCSQRERVTVRV